MTMVGHAPHNPEGALRHWRRGPPVLGLSPGPGRTRAVRASGGL